jgi:hypothetical protein
MPDLELQLENIDALDDSVKSFYIQDGDKFNLNPVIAGYQTRVTQMDSKISELLTETKQFKTKAKEASTLAAAKAQEVKDKELADFEKNNDFESYKKSTQNKHLKELTDKDDETNLYKNIAIAQSSGHDAMKLASEIAITVNGASTVKHLEPQFTARLRTVFVEGNATVEVLDKDGNLSAMTQKELQEEIKNMPINSMIVSGSKGKGAGVGANTGSTNNGNIDLSKMSPKQKLEYARSA